MLPTVALPPLLRLHAWSMQRPYFDLDGYMHRGWVLGYHSAARNRDNPRWHGRTRGRLHAGVTRYIAARAHMILRSDRDRARHDHPVDSVSVVLEGGYWEVLDPGYAATMRPHTYQLLLEELPSAKPAANEALMAEFNIHWRGPGSVVFRRAETSHRLVLPVGTVCKTLWLMGPKRRPWGFHTADGWVHWREYLGIAP